MELLIIAAIILLVIVLAAFAVRASRKPLDRRAVGCPPGQERRADGQCAASDQCSWPPGFPPPAEVRGALFSAVLAVGGCNPEWCGAASCDPMALAAEIARRWPAEWKTDLREFAAWGYAGSKAGCWPEGALGRFEEAYAILRGVPWGAVWARLANEPQRAPQQARTPGGLPSQGAGTLGYLPWIRGAQASSSA